MKFGWEVKREDINESRNLTDKRKEAHKDLRTEGGGRVLKAPGQNEFCLLKNGSTVQGTRAW